LDEIIRKTRGIYNTKKKSHHHHLIEN
jgi:hypothetical protein